MTQKSKKTLDLSDYEKKVKKVEQLVQKLREGKGPLEDALKQYEEGVRTIKDCLQTIEVMEKRINIISEDDAGSVTETPFE